MAGTLATASTPRAQVDASQCAKPRNRSIFWPNGPVTARHTKNREWLLTSETLEKPLVWNKSGPPTKEERMHRGEKTAPLLDAKCPVRLAGKAVCALRRDLNQDFGSKSTAVTTLFEPNLEPGRNFRHKEKENEYKDMSESELLEFVGMHPKADRGENLAKTIASLNKHRCLDSAVGPITTQAIPSLP
mmetsp:Transcript_37791/g.95812  ORF Transcript_37791/g.95812 Transcript_37791/m.95812 type:complete len:188 (-) Transcript_37791:77-640(-)